MKDEEANVRLIKSVYKRVEEFLDENDPEEFADIAQMERAFSRFLASKSGEA